YGWGLRSETRLVQTGGGQLLVGGGGGSRWFKLLDNGTYQSPAYDFGTLTDNGDTTFTYTAKDKFMYNFNSFGTLTSVVSPGLNGPRATYTYSASRLSTIQEPDGGLTTFSDDANNLLQTIADPGGRTVAVPPSSG